MRVLLAFSSLCMILSKAYSQYDYFYLENHCEPMKEKKITIIPTISGPKATGIIRPRQTESYSAKMFCTVNIFPPMNYIVIISVEKIDFHMEPQSRNPPEYLKICYPSCIEFTKPADYSKTSFFLESVHAAQFNYSTMGNNQTESLITGHDGFQLTYTIASQYENCNAPQRFKCKNKFCIPISLVCDGQNNCGDSSDEDCEVCGGCEKNEYLLDTCTKKNDFQWKTFNIENYDKESSILKPFQDGDYTTPFDCLVNFRPTYKDGVILSVENFQECSDTLKIYSDGQTTDLCKDAGKLGKPIHFIANSSMQLEYQTESSKRNFKPFNFSFVYTSYSSGADCNLPGLFKCANEKCISPYLVCDGHNNCGDLSDESCQVCGGCGYTKRYVEEICKKDSLRQVIFNVKAHSAGILQPRSDGRYSRRLLCHLIISPPKDHGVVLTVNHIRFSRIGECADSITVYDGEKEEKLCMNKDYRPEDRMSFSSTGRMHLYYDSTAFNGSLINYELGFHVVYTVFSQGTACNDTLSFLCGNGRCISSMYVCDEYNNCGDNSDEKNCATSASF